MASITYGNGTMQFDNHTGGTIKWASVTHSCYSSSTEHAMTTLTASSLTDGQNSSTLQFSTIVHGPTDKWYVSFLNEEGYLVTGSATLNFSSTYYKNSGQALITLNASNIAVEYSNSKGNTRSTTGQYNQSYAQS